ncbi:hypothetical protein LTS18_013973, partial [Coniosporium uncinatum]
MPPPQQQQQQQNGNGLFLRRQYSSASPMNFPEQQNNNNTNNNGGNALASPSAYSNPSPSLLSDPDLDPSMQYGAPVAAAQSPPAGALLAGYRKDLI